MSGMEGFFRIHDGLPREGPGSAEDVAWAIEQAGLRDIAHILDAGCGPGGDVPFLRAVAPGAQILAIDSHAPFIADLNARFANDPGVTGQDGDMMAAPGPFDLIWCAGALAERYREMGGATTIVGKPYAPIYATAISRASSSRAPSCAAPTCAAPTWAGPTCRRPAWTRPACARPGSTTPTWKPPA